MSSALNRLDTLSPEQEAKSRELAAQWRNRAAYTAPMDREFAERSIGEFYRLRENSAPFIVWCDSPVQLMLVPSIFKQLQTNGDQYLNELKDKLEATSPASPLLPALWQVVAEHREKGVEIIQSDDLPVLVSDLNMDLRKFTTSLFSRLGARISKPVVNELRAELEPLGDHQLVSLQVAAALNRDYDGLANTGDPRRGRATIWWARWDWRWLSFYQFFPLHVDPQIYDPGANETLNIWINLAQAAVAYRFYKNICFVCTPATEIHCNERGNLHSRTSSALRFGDGYAIYSWDGATVEPYVIEQPELITVEDITKEPNAAVRRIKILRYGEGRYLQDAGAQLVHQDKFGSLFIETTPHRDDEPLAMVKVVNSTPEPDGSYKEYFIRVPPEITSARDAIAWTFGLNGDEYDPSQQT